IDYTTQNGNALADRDYTVKSGRLDFAGGQTSATFTVPVLDNTVYDPGKGLVVRLTNPAGATLNTLDAALLTITENDQPPPSLPTKLAITQITPASPTVGQPFAVTIQARDANDTPASVNPAMAIPLSLKIGTGMLGGTLLGTIVAGTNSVTINGVTYSKAETGVVLTATRTSGDALAAGDSAPFNVVPTAAAGITWSTATLTQARANLAVTTVGDKALFAGGRTDTGYSAAVDIYTNATGLWSTAVLSQARYDLAAVTAGSKALFGGGWTGADSNVVDIYDNQTGAWSTATLSQARWNLAAAKVGGKALFAGGSTASAYSNVVDIYDSNTGAWSTATLSQARQHLAATTVGSKVLFAGGEQSGGVPSAVVDMYDGETGAWSTATLSQARYALAATTVGSKALFAGGATAGGAGNVVDIYDGATGVWSTATLSQARSSLAAAIAGGKALFAGGATASGAGNVVDIYDGATGVWSTATLSQARSSLAATSVSGKALFAGGDIGAARSNAVDLAAAGSSAGGGGKIVYESSQSGHQIFQTNPDGADAVALTGAPIVSANYPKYSRDGSKVAFEDWIDEIKHLWVINVDGAGLTKVSETPIHHATLLWTPDGRIMFTSAAQRTYTIRPDGTNLVEVTGWPAGCRQTSWSPDGTRLLAHCQADGRAQIFAVNPDGSNPVRFSTNSNDSHAYWSPDGTRIAFNSDRSGQADIWTMDADGSHPRQLTFVSAAYSAVYPRWSPDGARIVFSANTNAGNFELFVINADGSGMTNITNTSATEQWSDWGPYPPFAQASALAISAVSPQSPHVAPATFAVTIQSRDAGGALAPTAQSMEVRLSVKTGIGALSGQITGAIPAGQNAVTITGVTYSTAATGVVLRADDDAVPDDPAGAETGLMPGDSAPFTVLATASGEVWTPPAVNASTAWVAGASGFIAKTVDGGATWAPQSSGAGMNLLGVAAAGAGTAWAVGDDRVIRKTTDGGAAWTAQTSAPYGLRHITALNASTAWAVGYGGVILKTTDGGANWTAQAQASGDGPVYDRIAAVDADTAWISGRNGGTILHTTDGGAHWAAQTSGTAQDLYGLAAVNATTAWAVGPGGTMLKTTDGGVSWTAQAGIDNLHLTAVAAVDVNIAWTVGFNGAILHTGPDTTPSAIAVQSGNGQSAAVGAPLATPLKVRVTDSSGSPAAGVPVAWRVSGIPTGALGQSFGGTAQRIAFQSKRDNPSGDLYLMNTDGSSQTRLTNTDPNSTGGARWSPDGAKVAFYTQLTDGSGSTDIYTINADGTGLVQLTTSMRNSSPVWSPDGRKLAFTSERDGNTEIYVMNADGSGQTRLTTNSARDEGPAWSPDGGKISFTSNRDGFWEVYVMNTDGSGQTRLTAPPSNNGGAAWTPDSGRIAFKSDREGSQRIYVMNADGSSQTVLPVDLGGALEGGATWSPEGGKLAFTGFVGAYEIFVADAAGGGQTRLTVQQAQDVYPAWSPAVSVTDGNGIAQATFTLGGSAGAYPITATCIACTATTTALFTVGTTGA
ncbi:MAG: YCF48-related protein, partial [Chloroflexi bacterium]|nr:YCF48-related protein [Chloroflexota bacterium]